MKSVSINKLARFSAMCLACAIVATNINPSFAQSTDRDNPTPLTVKLLSNPGKQNKNTVYYYSLTAKPGKINITVDCDAGSVNDAFFARVKIQTLDGKERGRVSAGCSPGSPERSIKEIEFKSETPVLLVLNSSGYHKIKIEGDWTQSGSASAPPAQGTVAPTPTKPESKPDTPVTAAPKPTTPTPEMLTTIYRKEPELNYSEEQTLTVSCNSTGQVCDNSAVFNVRPSQNRNFMEFIAPSTHCSVVNYFVEDAKNPKNVIRRIRLAPGKIDFVPAGSLAKGSTQQFRIRATGVKGGCNTGRLESWSVKVRVLSSGEL
jgi:hypothetical protein